MASLNADTPIEFLKGVGPHRADALKRELNIYTVLDLAYFFPFRYVDKSRLFTIAEVSTDDTYYQFKAKILSVQEVGAKFKKRLVVMMGDETGAMELVWFKGYKYVKPSLFVGKEYFVFGKPTFFNNKYNFSHPEIEEAGTKSTISRSPLQAIYHSGEKLAAKGLTSRGVEKLMYTLLKEYEFILPEILSADVRKKNQLDDRITALRNIHFPENATVLTAAKNRIKFEELFFLQLRFIRQKAIHAKNVRGHFFEKVGNLFNDFYHHHLPFPLTNAQMRVIKEIRKDCGSGKQMNRLLQGDVGSGKTAVALLCMLIALDNGFQACLMAPTEILAQQHLATLTEFLKDVPVRVELLTGSTKAAKRREILNDLHEGTLHILIGTHALIEPDVQFKHLGLAVIDEQHRFGVEQRSQLWKKSDRPPHMLVMTATPIPRTLAMTLYGDLDLSVIDEMPPGRKAIKTIHRYDSSRLGMFTFLEEEIAKGRQVYIVYPLINESEKSDYKDLMDGYESICRRFPLPKYKVSIVHGKMKSDAKAFEMDRFVRGETNILVATTVIEVGVNVPNASVMVIESTERFGLSQLHQLRGRVGRGADQSYCILMSSEKLSDDARKRIDILVTTQDGFVIADEDMKMRGPGDIAGTQQSGILQMRLADLTRDGEILQQARDAALEIIENDTDLTLPENAMIRQEWLRQEKEKPFFARIS
ncbi:MAG: ATP-dependent DNA helicase RecG [Flavobacteriales bacterium]